MTMSFLLQDHIDSSESCSPASGAASASLTRSVREEIHILSEKLEVPAFEGLVHRPRLNEMLTRSLEQFSATLVSGRAGMGKTAMAAEYARTRKSSAWYSVESSDVDWNIFAHYFAASVLRGIESEKSVADLLAPGDDAAPSTMAVFLLNVVCELERSKKMDRPLLVLDGIHHLFDAEWFGGLFSVLLPSLSETADLLLLCRSKPPNPLWRLRSKQQLNVIDEKVIAFTRDEAIELFNRAGGSEAEAVRRHAETFGRISKLLPFLNLRKTSSIRH